jgi:hypothetical protein
MAKTKTVRTTPRRTAPADAVRSIRLDRLRNSANFAVFGLDIPRGTIAPFGKVYIPLDDAEGVQTITVALTRNGGR